MNAETNISQLPPEPFDLARDNVNAWRGRCLDAFARAEEAVTETLLRLAENDRGKSLRLLHLVGQRFDELSIALSENGPFSGECKGAYEALQIFRQHNQLRVLLCHGVGKITLDKRGRWTVIMRILALRQRKATRSEQVLHEDEAEQLADELAKASKRLCSQLGQLRSKVS